MRFTSVRRRVRHIDRRVRTARLIAKALKSPFHPILAQIVPIRRCNLACAYCNEFDKTSAPVPLDLMLTRIDRIAGLGTSMIDLSGGEPLLHPELDEIIRRIRHHGIVSGLLTNGYLLTRERIERLNSAGLDRLQISIDNVTPDAVSHKSLDVLDRRLRLLADAAEFDVNINTVVGSALRPTDARVIAERARSLGLGTSVGLVHDSHGQMVALGPEQQDVHRQILWLGRRFFSHPHDALFQQNLTRGAPNAWHCRAGSRYLYVCEDGLAHWCSQQRGYPAIPLERYSVADLERENQSAKSCAPFCTVSCVHRVALLDALRERPLETIEQLGRGDQPPVTVKLLTWMFVTGRHRDLFRRLALHTLRTH